MVASQDTPDSDSSSTSLLEQAGKIWSKVEDWSIALALGIMMLLPIVEIVLRQFDTGISGNAGTRRHLVLFVALIGGVVAARQGRLLSLSTFTAYLKGRVAIFAQTYSASITIYVTFMLGLGSWQYLQATLNSGRTLIFGMPAEALQAIMPIGFALLGIRFWWRCSDNWIGRLVPLFGALAFALLINFINGDSAASIWILIAALLLATVLGSPIFITLGGAAFLLLWYSEFPYQDSSFAAAQQSGQVVALNLYQITRSPMLVTLPLFTLAGYYLTQGHSSRRLIRLISALFRDMRGSAAIVTVVVCAFFTTFTGASGVTILALGGLLLPVLKSSGYDDHSSIGLLTGAGSLGVLFPPCLPLILYAVVASAAGISITLNEVFLGGFLPGVLLVSLTIAWGIWKQPPKETVASAFDFKELGKAAIGALGELLLPIVALVSLFSGYATPVEAASVSALYAFCLYLVEAVWIRKAKVFDELPSLMAECGLLVGGVLLILGVAMGFTNYLVTAMIPDQIVGWATEIIESPLVFLLALNFFLIIVGCLMDIFSAIIVIVPLIAPLGAAFGINPVHLGIIFLANLQLGYITPPIGMNLFLASYRFEKPMAEVIKATLPMLLVFIFGVLIITYVPTLTTWLPSLLAN